MIKEKMWRTTTLLVLTCKRALISCLSLAMWLEMAAYKNYRPWLIGNL